MAAQAEKRCHAALRKHHLRGEWFIARAGDDAARLAFDCFAGVVAAVAKQDVKVGSLDMAIYDRCRKRYQSVFGRGWQREPSKLPVQLPGTLQVAAKP
jgi:hypothetical protein